MRRFRLNPWKAAMDRQREHEREQAEHVAEIMRLAVKRQREVYAEGIADGFKIVLTLVLGEPIHGTKPYGGPIPDELREWAIEAKEKITTQNVSIAVLAAEKRRK